MIEIYLHAIEDGKWSDRPDAVEFPWEGMYQTYPHGYKSWHPRSIFDAPKWAKEKWAQHYNVREERIMTIDEPTPPKLREWWIVELDGRSQTVHDTLEDAVLSQMHFCRRGKVIKVQEV